MKGASVPLLLEALHEMERHYSREELRRHLPRLYNVMKRSSMLTEQEKGQVKKILETTYGRDWFIETLPEVIDLVAQGEARGEIKGELKEARRMLEKAVDARFPALVAQAKERAECSSDPNELSDLVVEIIKAPNEAAAQRLLVEYGRE
jgi:hypothetical protein